MPADFISTLVEMRGGNVVMDVNRKFTELLEAIQETGQKGKLTLILNVAPSKFSSGGTVAEVETSHDCSIKKPELSIGKSLFFFDRNGALTRDDPAQTEMFTQEETRSNG